MKENETSSTTLISLSKWILHQDEKEKHHLSQGFLFSDHSTILWFLYMSTFRNCWGYIVVVGNITYVSTTRIWAGFLPASQSTQLSLYISIYRICILYTVYLLV